LLLQGGSGRRGRLGAYSANQVAGPEIDNTANGQHAANLMHPSRLSEPMRWLLTENPAALRVECTGFGLNLVSGNYEFACLVVVQLTTRCANCDGHPPLGYTCQSCGSEGKANGASTIRADREPSQ
jgi:hypothetical protein